MQDPNLEAADSEAFRSTEGLHSEFRTITMLLTLVTSINNDGHPTLLAQRHAGNYRGPQETPQSNHGVSLNAITTILVRDTKVVTAIAHDPSPPSSSSSDPLTHESMKPKEEMTYQVFAIQADRQWDQLGPQDTIDTIITLANHDRQDKYFKKCNSACFVVRVADGESHWPS